MTVRIKKIKRVCAACRFFTPRDPKMPWPCAAPTLVLRGRREWRNRTDSCAAFDARPELKGEPDAA